MPPHGIWEGGDGGHGHSHGGHGHSHGSHGHSHGGLVALIGKVDSSRLLPCACWRSGPAVERSLAIRVAIRLVMLGVIIALIRAFPGAATAAGNAVIGAITSLGTPFSELAFFAGATGFCAVSPTGYLPAVAAGITFPPAASIPITYASVSLGALLNVILVRAACRRRLPGGLAEKYASRGATLLGSTGLASALRAQPIKIVALLRLPFLGNGALNYILSLHDTLSVRDMVVGNAVGLAPGSVLFPLAGSQLRSLGTLLADGAGSGAARDAAIGWFVGISFVVLLCTLIVITVVKRVLAKEAREVAAREEAAAAAAAADVLPPSDSTFTDDDIAHFTAAMQALETRPKGVTEGRAVVGEGPEGGRAVMVAAEVVPAAAPARPSISSSSIAVTV